MRIKVLHVGLLALLINIPYSYSQDKSQDPDLTRETLVLGYDNTEELLTVYPNPVEMGFFQYATELPNNVRAFAVNIFDLTGKRAATRIKILSAPQTTFDECFDLGISEGVYFIQLIYKSETGEVTASNIEKFIYH